jgi:fructose-bisphosphate aldolase class II
LSKFKGGIINMSVVSAKDMLIRARKEGYGVAQININNLEWIKAVLTTVEELKSPVILGVSEGAAKYMGGYRNVMAMVKELDAFYKVSVPVAVHLDHGTYEGAYKALEAGFTSIMFDGSHYPFEENLAKTKEIVAACHAKGVSVEAEVGSIGGEEDGVVGLGEVADPKECAAIAATGVDMFAAGIGNIHGKYPANWPGLRFDVLQTVSEVTGGVPLVLHGGTGIPAHMVKKAISMGVSKINVNTELQLAFAAATRKYIEDGKDLESKGFDPRKLLNPGYEAIKTVIREKLEMFGSVNKA